MNTELHQRAKSCANNFKLSERELFAVLLEVDQAKLYEDFEFTFLTPYCIKELDLSEDVAAVHVRVARKTLHVPLLGEAVIKGDLSVHKAKVICSAITPENAQEWIDKARKTSKKKLEAEVKESNGIKTRRRILDLEFETDEKLERVQNLECTRQAKFVSLEDALDAACDAYLYANDPLEKAKRAKKSGSQAGIRHAVNERDETRCQVIYKDGTQCTEEKWLHMHHVIHQKDGGPDTVENLVTMCAAHHRLLHRHH